MEFHNDTKLHIREHNVEKGKEEKEEISILKELMGMGFYFIADF